MSIRVCEEHDNEDCVVVYDGTDCPLCEQIETNKELEDENSELEDQIKDLEKQLESKGE